MPSEFLKDRHRTFFKEVGGQQTVQYIAFDESVKDSLTGEVTDEAAAYPDDPITLPALIDFNPSESAREKIGQDIKFDVIVRITDGDLTDKEIALKIGDAFILPDGDKKYYVKRFFKNMQSGGDFLEWMLALSRRSGRA